MAGYRIAVVGATGLVGQTLLQILEEQKLPVALLVALARESQGRFVDFAGEKIPVEPVAQMDWSRVDVAFFAAGNPVSEVYAPIAVQAGVTVIDKSSHWRMDPAVPLLVPEVNGAVAGDALLLASPNCSTIQLVVALAPLHRQFGLDRVIVSTYQAVSGTGREAADELERQTRQVVAGEKPEPEIYSVPIVQNVLPLCDAFGDSGYTGEEWKLTRETTKILGTEIHLSATAVRVPVYVGHAESVYVETTAPWTLDAVREALLSGPSVRLVDGPERGIVPTPQMAAGQDDVLVGRVRRDLFRPQGLHLFVVADNLRRGAATNAVDIMRMLASRWQMGAADR